MYELTEHIEYLVYQNECVTIPGVGAIVVQHVPAFVDSERNCIFPPRRELSFNPGIKHDDGLLAASVARREKVSYEKASTMVAQSVSDMMTCLDSQREVSLGHFGILRKNAEHNVEFLATNAGGMSLYAGAYSPLPLRAEEEQPKAAARRFSEQSLMRRFLNVAASVVLLVMLGLMLSTPVIDSDAVMASMASLKFGATEKEQPVLSADIDLNIAYPDPETSTGIAPERTLPDVTTENDNMYYIIVASLPNEEKAREFIASSASNGEQLRILNTKTRCRVYIDRAETLQQALAVREQDNRLQKYPDAWVFRN